MKAKEVNPFRMLAYILFIIASAIALFYGIFIFLGFSGVSLMFMLLKLPVASNVIFFIGLIYLLLGLLLVGISYAIKELRHPALFGFTGLLIAILTFNSIVVCLAIIAFLLSLMA